MRSSGLASFALVLASLAALAAAEPGCNEDDPAPAGGGGSAGAGGAAGAAGVGGSGGQGGSTIGATCASTCSKSIALGCASGEHDQAACVASCTSQQAACSGMASIFQTYLDCIQSTPMECGTATGAPSSPQCMQQGLATLACALTDGGTDAGDAGDAGGFTPVLIASNVIIPSGIAARAGTLYWADQGSPGPTPADAAVYRLAPGGTPEAIEQIGRSPERITVDADGVYWTVQPTGIYTGPGPNQDGEVHALMNGSATPVVLYTGLTWPQSISVAGSDLYWTSLGSSGGQAQGTAWFGAKAGGGTPAIALQQAGYVDHVFAGASGVWVTSEISGFGLQYVPKGAAAQVLATAESQGIDGDGTWVYYVARFNKSIERVPVGGGAAETVLSDPSLGDFYELAVDATYVYWTNGDGWLRRAPIAGGASEKMAQAGGDAKIAVDDTAVYFTNAVAQTVSKIVK